MGYPAKLLGEDEDVVLDLRPHVKRLVVPVLTLLVLAAAYGYLLSQVTDGRVRLAAGAVDCS